MTEQRQTIPHTILANNVGMPAVNLGLDAHERVGSRPVHQIHLYKRPHTCRRSTRQFVAQQNMAQLKDAAAGHPAAGAASAMAARE